jgi:hypothetical protein
MSKFYNKNPFLSRRSGGKGPFYLAIRSSCICLLDAKIDGSGKYILKRISLKHLILFYIERYFKVKWPVSLCI